MKVALMYILSIRKQITKKTEKGEWESNPPFASLATHAILISNDALCFFIKFGDIL